MAVASVPARQVCIQITDESQVGEARREAMLVSAALGFDETTRGRAGIVVTEAAANLLRHAVEGILILQPLFDGPRCGLEVLAVDKGPGMPDPARCLQDGYSTAGTPGTGLGAITRLAHEFDLDSHVGKGTVVLARIWREAPAPDVLAMLPQVGGVSTPVRGERLCGDAWAVARWEGRMVVAVVDGLGHGEQAEVAAQRAIEIFRGSAAERPAQIVEAAHGALRVTRGAAMAVAEISTEVRFAGVGNIAGSVIDRDKTRGTASLNGIVGHQMTRAQEFTYPWTPTSLLILASDGLRTHWRLDEYPGLPRRHPSVIAATLWRDYSRGRDDVTVVVARGDRYAA